MKDTEKLAFPHRGPDSYSNGMTLRDYFAAKAMPCAPWDRGGCPLAAISRGATPGLRSRA